MDGIVRFTARIEQHKGMDAGYIIFPYDVKELYGVNGQVKVRATFEGTVEYRGSLAKMGFPCHVLGITKEIRQKLGKSLGDTISVEIQPDAEKREVVVPEDVKLLLDQHPHAKRFFDGLSYTERKEYIRWIDTAQKEETRARRIGITLDKLKKKKKFSDL